MKRLITYGNYDLLHFGHIDFLKRAKMLGDYLIVSLADEEYNLAHSKKRCYFSFEERKFMLEAIKYVDLVIPQLYGRDKITEIVENNIDICVMGEDWKGKFDFLKEVCEVIYIPRSASGLREMSTSKIKNDLSQQLK